MNRLIEIKLIEGWYLDTLTINLSSFLNKQFLLQINSRIKRSRLVCSRGYLLRIENRSMYLGLITLGIHLSSGAELRILLEEMLILVLECRLLPCIRLYLIVLGRLTEVGRLILPGLSSIFRD